MSLARKTFVISAINLTEAGPLSVLQDCVNVAVQCLTSEWDIVVLVNRLDLLEVDKVQLLAFPNSKKSWLYRLYYEWWHFKRLSKSLNADVWLSLHDITPNVTAGYQAVYCHNATPFYQMAWREISLEPKLWLFTLFYRYLYSCGIQRNDAVIVQQDWLREEFKRLFKVQNVIVAHPVTDTINTTETTIKNKWMFFYPTLPRVFKQIEVVCEAAKLLHEQTAVEFEVYVTIKGDENRYAASVFKQYGHLDYIKFIGRQTREAVFQYYADCDCVLFPSLLETWGLPISEAKAFKKPLLVADLPYAHETVGDYDKIAFLNPHSAPVWAETMQLMMTKKIIWTPAIANTIAEPFAENWRELLTRLTTGMQSCKQSM
ncbi:UDP-N-acetylglucosamine--peptide N-acetylglucosaminyltransferase GtfA subunit [uncultured bacterium]|nr:UDP-N-acetylglucosamine--peptide N-acetylglucosaminyltransferase GtfA subunit [uncultured bacterium]